MSTTDHDPGFADWYNARCEAASRDEKFHILSPALAHAGIEHQIEQTGGFCMVLSVAHPTGTYTVTLSDDEPDAFLCVWHPGDTWQTGEYADDLALDWTVHVEAVPTLVAIPPPGFDFGPDL